MRRIAIAIIALVLGCDDDGAGAARDGGTGDGGSGPAADARVVADAGPASDAEACQPPDMLFVLDRTMSMHRRPDGSVPANDAAGHAESKWYLAITTIEAVTANLDRTIRFGLSLFPIDRGDDVCVTLSERIGGTTATNVQCEAGELAVAPALGSSSAIDAALDPEATRLCRSTPIGGGLETAVAELAAIRDPIRAQYATLITDGQDTCDEALSLANANALAADGVHTYVIGFDGSGSGVDNGHLNDLACAGRTAPDFATACESDGSGGFVAADRNGAPLYFLAEDAAQLQAQLEEVAGEICCDCID